MRRYLIAACAGALLACGSAGDGSALDASVEPPEAATDGAIAVNDGGAEAHDADSGEAAPPLPVDAATEAAAPPCPEGATLLRDLSACPGVRPKTPSGLSGGAAAAVRGDVISLGGLDEGTLPCLPLRVCSPVAAPTLLFSDSPESPTSSGVLYADEVGAGAYRIYVYHANGGTTPRKFPVLVLNRGASDAHVTIVRAGVAPSPSQDYVGLGKSVAAAWLAAPPGPTLTVPPGQRVLLDSSLDALHAAKAELVHAIYDVTTDAPVKISVVSVDAAADAVAVAAGLPLLASAGGDGRGTFPGADLLLVGTAPLDGLGMTHLRLGGGVTDADLVGTDATTGAAAKLTGNFGVLYRMRFEASAKIALAIAPRGTSWGGAADIAPGDDSALPFVLLPSGQTALATTTDAILLGRFAAGTAPTVRLLTAGGSNLPIDLVVAPLP